MSVRFSGIQKLTLLDYPGKSACIVFTPGCNMRCGFCHNPEFVLPEKLACLAESFIPQQGVLNFLRQRRDRIEGVVVSGGEPTVQPDLEEFLVRVKQLGFCVKLDTNGMRPAVMQRLISRRLVDYVAMDFKTSLAAYPRLVGLAADVTALRESLRVLRAGESDYELRATLIRELHTPAILRQMGRELAGIKRLYLQTFRSGVTLDPSFRRYHPFSPAEMEHIAQKFFGTLPFVGIREE